MGGERMKITLVTGRIEEQNTQVIVNPTNAEMVWEETTTNGDIHNAGGHELDLECIEYVKKYGKLKRNDTIITSGYRIPADILHVYPPFYELNKSLDHNIKEMLDCYQKCLDVAKHKRYKSISFPLLGAGAFMYPQRVSFFCFYETASKQLRFFNEIRLVLLKDETRQECENFLQDEML